MIEYAISLARDSGLFDRVIVSTDSAEIREVAERAGAEVPFQRPAALAHDHATTAAVLAHALEAVGARDRHDYACCLYPATPFATRDDLAQGLALVHEGGAGSALAVTPFPAPIWRAFRHGPDDSLAMLWPEHRNTRSQDLPEAVHDVGQFYWVPVARFLDDPVLFTTTMRGVVFPRWRAHDIDTEEDWVRAEAVYDALTKERRI